MSDIKFKATVDSKKGEVSLKELDKGVGKLEKSTQKTAGGFKALAAKVAVGVAAFYAASKALRGLIKWMGDAVEKAGIQELAEKEVAAALRSTGREVIANTEHFKQYASKLQAATVFGDEQILSAQALMIQLTKLDREGLDMATKGAIGLASVYKTDLQASTTLVGKALAGNYGALSRYGLTVERTATAEEKRASLLSQLLVMYERAEAETDTYQGTVKQLSNTYGDLKEEAGKAVTENEDLRDVMKDIQTVMKDIIDSGMIPEIFTLIAEGLKTLAKFDMQIRVLVKAAELLHKKAEKTRELRIEDEKIIEQADAIINFIRDEGEAIKTTTEIIDTQIQKVQGISVGMDFWGMKIVQIDELYKNLQNTLMSIDQWLPDPRDLTGVLEQAVPEFEEGTTYIGDLFKGMSKEQIKGMEATWAVSKQIGATIAMKNKEIAYTMAVINTAEAVTKALAGAVPPFNLILAGISAAAGAVQIATIAKQSVPTAARGAYLPSETILEAGHGAHGELVLKPEQLPQVVKEIIREPFKAGGVNIVIDIKEQLDPYTAQRITRNQIIPQILEALDINEEKKKWQDRLGIE